MNAKQKTTHYIDKKLLFSAFSSCLLQDGEIAIASIDFKQLSLLTEEITNKFKKEHHINIDNFATKNDLMILIIHTVENFIKSSGLKADGIEWLSNININHKSLCHKLEEIIQTLHSTPLTISIPLPKIAPQAQEIHINQDIRIAKDYLSRYLNNEDIPTRARLNLNSQDKILTTTLKTTCTGYAAYDIGHRKIQQALDNTKIIIYLLDLFYIHTVEQNNHTPRLTYKVCIANNNKTENFLPLPPALNEALCEFSPDMTELTKITKYFDKITETSSQRAQSVKQAIVWLFEAKFCESIEKCTIYTSIALEYLSGHKSKDDISESISEKISSYIADDFETKNKIKSDIKKFYKYRSDIVHGRLGINYEKIEKYLLKTTEYLQTSLLSAIRHEI